MDAHGKSEDCCRAPKQGCGPCPTCGRTTRPVTALTLAGHLPASMAAEFGDRAAFCPNPGCDTVYCNSEGKTASRDQLNSPVTVKDLADAVPVCSCCLGNVAAEIAKIRKESAREKA